MRRVEATRGPGTAMRSVGLMLALALVATSCAERDDGNGSGNAGGESIEYGADKSVYIEALQDMEPVELVIQSTGPQDSATGRRFEDYAAAVEEWSGGKITFDFVYSNAVADPAETHDAIGDGRLDMGSVMPSLAPAEFPASNLMWDLSYLGNQEPVSSILQWHGIMFELAVAAEEIDAEYEEHGMQLLLPAFGSGAYMTYCTEEGTALSDFQGRGISSQSRIQNTEAEALGMQPSSIAYTEMFESLQRGVVDCAITTVTGAALGGYIDNAPHVTYAPETGYNSPGGSIAISLHSWESLPLPAQQLMIDRLDLLMQANFEGAWENTDAAVEQVLAAGGSFSEYDQEAIDALDETHQDVLDEVAQDDLLGDGGAFVDGALEAEERWAERVAELDIEGVDVGYEEFPEWYADGPPDLQAYFDVLWADVMDQRRPE